MNKLDFKIQEKLQEIGYQALQKENLEQENEQRRQADFSYHSQRFNNLRQYLICLRNVNVLSNWAYKRAIKKLRKQALEMGIQFS